MRDLTPKKIVEELDKYIIGQDEAKRMVAIALRNRWRRQQLPPELRDEVAPKNIMLIGPTGVGKTEIARRLANLVSAPFLKVEVSKYTEVGYHGRDVESMVRDLVEVSVNMVKNEEASVVQPRAEANTEERILDILLPRSRSKSRSDPQEDDKQREQRYQQTREKLREKLRKGELDNREIEVTVEERIIPFMQVFSGSGYEEFGFDMQGALSNLLPGRKSTKKLPLTEARKIIRFQESEKLIDMEKVRKDGVKRAEELGIIFIDEVDKIVGSSPAHGPDVSREGVQRDLLPIVEGSTVMTRYGTVKTDHILFIAAGAFTTNRPTDLIPELQGRFPLRAELKSLNKEDFIRILKEPKNALLKQYKALLDAEGIKIEFQEDAIEEMSEIASALNLSVQDIGARRLHTVVEKVLEEISFQAADIAPTRITIDSQYVQSRLQSIMQSEDLKRYIL
jgi:ATP-dependent HslUV protease ATP-binding subunit HslU